MKVTPTSLPEVLLITPDIHGDHRGYFLELWNQERYSDPKLPKTFAQENLSFSKRGTLRGLHFQNPHPQGKLVTVLEGEVFDVAVDVRKGSPMFGKWVGMNLNGTTKQQLYVPPGFAHGFVVLSESALFYYKCTTPYRAESERVVLWNDPAIGIEWPMQSPTLSPRDTAASVLADIEQEFLTFRSEPTKA